MSAGRHRLQRERRVIPVSRVASVAAPAVTVSAVGLGLTAAEGSAIAGGEVQTASTTTAAAAARPANAITDVVRDKSISRSYDRSAPLTVKKQEIKRWATGELNLRTTPTDDAEVTGEIEPGAQVRFTGLTQGDYAEVLWKGERRWVTASYLSDKKPVDPADLPLSMKPCPTSGVESGLTSNAVRVHRAVCNAFPDISRYGGRAGRGEHGTGQAIDIMVTGPEGDKIAEFLKANAAELEIFDVIWEQRIWTPVRAGEGWRGMPNRGSATANHFDHVHVKVN